MNAQHHPIAFTSWYLFVGCGRYAAHGEYQYGGHLITYNYQICLN
jgi:hypothetical protein